jgi:hypothetical protein
LTGLKLEQCTVQDGKTFFLTFVAVESPLEVEELELKFNLTAETEYEVDIHLVLVILAFIDELFYSVVLLHYSHDLRIYYHFLVSFRLDELFLIISVEVQQLIDTLAYLQSISDVSSKVLE